MQPICRYDPILDDNDNNDNGDDDNDDWRSMMMGWYNDSQLRVEGRQAAKSVLLSSSQLLQGRSTLLVVFFDKH